LLRPREVTDRTNLQVLSVYRDYGVIPKDSRSDNFNKTPEDITRYQEVRVGDLVVNKMKAWQGSVGISTYHGIVSPDYLVCSVDRSVDSRFMHHLLRSAPLAAEFGARSKGIRPAQWRLYWEDLAEVPITLPPLEGQRRIADFLDAETARIDSLVAKKQQVISVLGERIQAILNQVTSGEIILGVDGRPIGIAGLNCIRLGAIASVHGGFTMDERRDSGRDAVTMPYLRVANVLDGSLALEDVKEVTLPRVMAERCTLQPGDVLMTEGGDPDKLGRGTVWPGDFGPCLHQNAIFAVRPDCRLLPEYLALLTRTRYARAYFEVTSSKSTGIAHTSSTKITGFRVPLPPVDEQRRIAAAVSEAAARIGALREPSLRQLTLLAERRQALITAAVTGGIAV
jgi:type I restriction enzyme S subunit